MEGEGRGGSCNDDQHHHHHHLLSEDVLIQILSCLPVTSLLRFKSVCKSWRSIIQSPFFTHLHATKLGDSRVLFNRGEELQEGEEKRGNIFMLSSDEFEVFEDSGRPPWVDLGEEFEVLVGCCNGIICLEDNFSRCVALWNPAIKQSRILHKPSNLLGRNSRCVAFGVDVKTKDYKVLLITNLQSYETNYWSDLDDYEEEEEEEEEEMFMKKFYVYSSSTDSWRCVDDDTLSATHPNLQICSYVPGGLYLNGSHFFTATCQIKVEENFRTIPLIMSFDFTEEIFRTIQPPYDWSRKKNTNTSVVYFIPFDEKIALVDAKANSLHSFECYVWVLLNEQHSGVKESWTKFYTYESNQSPIALRCIANNGQFAIIYCPDPGQHTNVWKLQLLNLITGETKCLQSGCQGRRVDLNVSIYKPSLVQIDR